MSLDGFSMHRLVRELSAALTGGRIDRVSQPNKQTMQIAIRQPGKNHLLTLSIHPRCPILYQPDAALENPPEPPSFCMLLRKHLETGRIAAIRQHGLDRVIVLDVDFLAAGGRIVTKSLVAELMGKYSNLILVEDGQIIDALRRVGANSSRVRLVLPGNPYEPPPDQGKRNLLETPPEVLLSDLKQRGDRKLAAALSDVCQGFGPVSAREVAFGAGLAADLSVSALDDADLAAVASSLRETAAALEDPAAPPCLVRDENGKLLAMAAFPLHYLGDATVETFPDMDHLAARAEKLLASFVPPDKERFQRLLKNELNRARGKAEKLREEAATAETAESVRIMADTLMTYQYQLRDHADASCELPNLYDPEGPALTISLDQRLTVQQNVQNYYRKYNKLKRAQSLLREQIDACAEEIRYLGSIEASLSASSTLAELGEIRDELIAGGWLREKVKKNRGEKPSQPFHFQGPDGIDIWVGKNNAQNDRLTFKQAQRDDIWLHTKDIPGSHVILRAPDGAPSDAAIELAAQLAAWFSQARGSSNVPVDYTPCRYVKKPSGAKPGFVIFTNQKTLYVTPEEPALAPLLRQQDL